MAYSNASTHIRVRLRFWIIYGKRSIGIHYPCSIAEFRMIILWKVVCFLKLTRIYAEKVFGGECGDPVWGFE